MVGSIDPRCETLRGTHWPVKVAGVFGTRVAENHLGQRFKATASTGRTYGCKRSDQTLKNSCGTGAVHIWVPAFAGTTASPAIAQPRRNSVDGELDAAQHLFIGILRAMFFQQFHLHMVQRIEIGKAVADRALQQRVAL